MRRSNAHRALHTESTPARLTPNMGHPGQSWAASPVCSPRPRKSSLGLRMQLPSGTPVPLGQPLIGGHLGHWPSRNVSAPQQPTAKQKKLKTWQLATRSRQPPQRALSCAITTCHREEVELGAGQTWWQAQGGEKSTEPGWSTLRRLHCKTNSGNTA